MMRNQFAESRGIPYISWVQVRAIGKGIDFHDFGMRNGIYFGNFGIRNGIDTKPGYKVHKAVLMEVGEFSVRIFWQNFLKFWCLHSFNVLESTLMEPS